MTSGYKEGLNEGDLVMCVLVTGEKATGIYSCTKESTGSHLIEQVITEDGRKADFAWAVSVEKI